MTSPSSLSNSRVKNANAELPSQPVVGFALGCRAVAGSRQGMRQVDFGGLEVARDLGEATFGVGDLSRQAVLLALEQVERDGVRVVGIE